MELVSPILDVVTRLWNGMAERAVHIKDLQEKMEALRNAMQQLKERRDDVKERVLESEGKQPRTKCTNEVQGWLDRVQDMEKVVDEILGKGEQEIQKKSIFQRSLRSSYKLGKKASEMLPAVTQLWSTGHFDVVVHTSPQPQSPADERPMQETVGLGALYEEVCRCIKDDRVGIIGLYGMGGAGKTTLMTKVNNEFIAAPINNDYYFDIAIWVVVSRPANLGKIQEVILNKLRIPDHSWRNRSHDEKAVEIFYALKGKRFVLMLDDVWERLDLQKVGVPPPKQYSQNRSKVILTTRSLDVCRHMEAQRSIQVVCLTEEEAIHLFKEKVGETTLNSHPQIPKFAEIAAKECKGLPLALVTIGRAMAGKNTPQEWERAIEILKTYPSEFSGMGDYVFPILKFSYDNLPNDTIRNCFLYLAIFPEDYLMSIEKLIILWIGEGFLDGWDSIKDAFDHGHDVIEHLKTASLFESTYRSDAVKMHDVIRDMALWLAANTGDRNKILGEEVESRVEVVRQSSKWKDARRMHLRITTSIEQVTRPFSFPNLLTLIVWTGDLHGTIFPSGFFRFMPIIKVLDLEGTDITQLPVEIGKLVTLEHLNLSRTGIRELPWELSTLKVLRCLLLGDMGKLEVISKGVISNLSMMRFFVFSISFETFSFWEDNKEILEELEGLEHINCVNFQVIGTLCFQKLLNSQKLQDVMRELVAEKLEDMIVLQLPKMKHLRYRKIRGGKKLEEIKVDDEEEEKELMEGKPGLGAYNYIPTSNFYHLRRVRVEGLPKLLHLGWLIHAPNLEYLYVRDCESMEEVVIINMGDDENILGVLFSRLEELHLVGLPNLWSISRQALPFPSLINLVVIHCPKLWKLPFDSNTAKNTNLKTIHGESGWWEGLQWEDEAVSLTFAPYHTIFTVLIDQPPI